MKQDTLRVLDIVPGTSVDGPGLRTSIYFAGCTHHCEGCHNPQSWDLNGGTEISIDRLMNEIDRNGFNVTFSGGDPLMQPIDPLCNLASRIKAIGYTIWCYTGYIYEQIASNPKFTDILGLIDVLVDGPFQASLRDTSLHFRGSSNQRIIDLQASTCESPVLWHR